MQRRYQKVSLIVTSIETIMRFHEHPNALKMLTPPPLIVQIAHDQRSNITHGTVDFVLWFGPFPVRWLARHEPCVLPTSFIDRMIIGPLAVWQHEHLFFEAAGGVALMDRITFRHKPGWRGWLTRILFDGVALRLLFWYRHWRTKVECENPSRYVPSSRN
jgi:ligand-binding SRPBCC domain-containing protein